MFILLSYIQTLKFGITLLVKDRGEKGKSKFYLKHSEAMQKAKVDRRRHDMLMNYTSEKTMLINSATSIPWRGAREKDARFMHFLIEGTTEEGDVVLDYTKSTGKLCIK